MAAKRKGGLKLNAICAKLSRQVVTSECGSQNADGDASLADNSERGSSHYDENDRPETDLLPEGVSQSLEEDQRRREAIEKWVNGEYGDESFDDGGGGDGPRGIRANNGGEDGPPEGVYMVQPKGCSDEEDNGDEPDALPGSHDDGSFHDDRDSEDGPHKEDSYVSSGEVVNRQAPFTSTGICPLQPSAFPLSHSFFTLSLSFSLTYPLKSFFLCPGLLKALYSEQRGLSLSIPLLKVR